MGKRNSRRTTKRRNIKQSRRKNNELTKNLLDGGMWWRRRVKPTQITVQPANKDKMPLKNPPPMPPPNQITEQSADTEQISPRVGDVLANGLTKLEKGKKNLNTR